MERRWSRVILIMALGICITPTAWAHSKKQTKKKLVTEQTKDESTDKIIEGATNIGEGVVDIAEGVVGIAGDAAETVIDTSHEVYQVTTEVVGDLYDEISDSQVGQAIGTTVDTIQQGATTVQEGITDLISDLTGVDELPDPSVTLPETGWTSLFQKPFNIVKNARSSRWFWQLVKDTVLLTTRTLVDVHCIELKNKQKWEGRALSPEDIAARTDLNEFSWLPAIELYSQQKHKFQSIPLGLPVTEMARLAADCIAEEKLDACGLKTYQGSRLTEWFKELIGVAVPIIIAHTAVAGHDARGNGVYGREHTNKSAAFCAHKISAVLWERGFFTRMLSMLPLPASLRAMLLSFEQRFADCNDPRSGIFFNKVLFLGRSASRLLAPQLMQQLKEQLPKEITRKKFLFGSARRDQTAEIILSLAALPFCIKAGSLIVGMSDTEAASAALD
jgi:hypothetical protein